MNLHLIMSFIVFVKELLKEREEDIFKIFYLTNFFLLINESLSLAVCLCIPERLNTLFLKFLALSDAIKGFLLTLAKLTTDIP
jgi:hypothetical protein